MPTRREFLKTAAGTVAGGTAAGASAVAATGRPSPETYGVRRTCARHQALVNGEGTQP